MISCAATFAAQEIKERVRAKDREIWRRCFVIGFLQGRGFLAVSIDYHADVVRVGHVVGLLSHIFDPVVVGFNGRLPTTLMLYWQCRSREPPDYRKRLDYVRRLGNALFGKVRSSSLNGDFRVFEPFRSTGENDATAKCAIGRTVFGQGFGGVASAFKNEMLCLFRVINEKVDVSTEGSAFVAGFASRRLGGSRVVNGWSFARDGTTMPIVSVAYR